MTGALVQFVSSASVIVIAGVFLARASDKIAELAGLGRLLVGSILLAGATSLPELFVDISAIRKSMPDLAVGDLMGSSLMNLLILGVADLLHRSPRKMFSVAGAEHALAAATTINVTALAAVSILLGPKLQNLAVGNVGAGPLAVGVVYILGLRLVYRNQMAGDQSGARANPEKRVAKITSALALYVTCALAILIAAPFLAEGAGKIADYTGLGGTVIGSTLVALCTSLPEVVTTFTAVRMGAMDLAVGNIFGSNSFNMLLFIPLDWFHATNLMADVAATHVLTAIGVIFTTSIVVMGQLYREEKRKPFLEPDALAVIFAVAGVLYLLYWTAAS